MIHVRRVAALVRPATLALAAFVASAAATAMPVSYQCIGYRTLTAEFTPREAQVHFEGKNWTLARLRDAREATYVNGHEGVRVVTKARDLTLTTGKETLACKLQSEALKPENLGIAPKEAPSAPSAAH
jgi:hypothetical protein